MHVVQYTSTYDHGVYTFWSMSGKTYLQKYDQNFACDSDSRVYLGMNNRFLISAYEGDPTDWGFQISIYSDSEVVGYLCDSGYTSPVSAIEAAILAYENYLTRNDLSLYVAA